MGNAFVHIKYNNKYDDSPYINVIYDDAEVLMYDVHEGGCFELFDWFEPEEIKTGYYHIEYEFEMEIESYEMTNVVYPVLSEMSFDRFTFLGGLKHLLISLYYLITNTNRYTIHNKEIDAK